MGDVIRPFSQSQIQDFAARWFQALDRHAPADELKPLLAGDALELIVPEDTFRGFEGFQRWYERAVHLFFDESHTLKEVRPTGSDGDQLTVKVVVNWTCRYWTPPEPHSKQIDMDAFQTWVLRPDAAGQPQVVRYVVDDVRYAPGSATL